MQRHIPLRMMEQAMAQRNRSVSLKPGKSRAALTITHPNAGRRIDRPELFFPLGTKLARV